MTGSGNAEQRRFGALIAADVRRLDAAAADAGLPLEVLMETAGWQLARAAWHLLARAPAPVLVCAGRGNNGGDALVVARQLAGWGCAVTVLLVGAAEPGPLVTEQRRRLQATAPSVAVIEVSDAAQLASGGPVAARVTAARLVVDGLLGSGLRGAPRELDAAMIAGMRHPRILSVDVPSGLDVDSGTAAGACVTAHTTCTLTAMKRGLWSAASRAVTGAILVADIGMPAVAWARAGLDPPSAVRGGALLSVDAVID